MCLSCWFYNRIGKQQSDSTNIFLSWLARVFYHYSTFLAVTVHPISVKYLNEGTTSGTCRVMVTKVGSVGSSIA